MDNYIRLDKFLSSQLNISRTDAKRLISQKRVSLFSGKTVRPNMQLDLAAEKVLFDGKEINYKKFLYIAQNKPAGVVSASSDDSLTVIDILPEGLKRQGLFPAGRLDKDSTGFVLITDDGEFAHNVLSPSHHIEKTYVITLLRNVTENEMKEITEGMYLADEKLKPAKLKKLADETYEIVLTQGRYHQIKRMFGFFHNPVQSLHRTKIGMLSLPKELAPGESRELTEDEIKLIK